MFRGSLPAMITPFTNGAVDFETLNAFIEWLAALMRPHLRTVMALTLRPEQRPTGTASALASEVPPIGPLGGIWRCL